MDWPRRPTFQVGVREISHTRDAIDRARPIWKIGLRELRVVRPFQGKLVGVVRPAAHGSPDHRLARFPVLAACVPNMVSDRTASMSVSSVVEHQI